MITPYRASTLVDRLLGKSVVAAISALERAGAPAITCDADTVLECGRIADGSLTPVDRFFGKEETTSVIEEQRLLDQSFFPLPILLPARGIAPGTAAQDVLLRTGEGKAFGYLAKASFYPYDLERLCRGMFGVYDLKHPGVARVVAGGNLFAGGQLFMLGQENDLSRYCLSPRQAREEIGRRAWKTCVGFQTRNVPHLAHEHLQRIALETHDGLLIHPIIGWKKSDDYRPDVVMHAYEYLTTQVYPRAKVLLSGLQMQMRYAGPKEAVIHAIVRQNYGCSHFIVGRDHAGVGGFYGRYEAQSYADRVQEHLPIRILKLKGPFYCAQCGGVVTENTCGHPQAEHQEVSGSLIREMLIGGKRPPSEFIRADVVDVVRSHDKIFIDS